MPYESLYIESSFWHDQTSSRYVWKLLSNDLYFDSFELQSTQIGHTSQYNCHHDKIILLAFCTFRLLTYAWDHPRSKYHYDSTLRVAMTIFVLESPVTFMQQADVLQLGFLNCFLQHLQGSNGENQIGVRYGAKTWACSKYFEYC